MLVNERWTKPLVRNHSRNKSRIMRYTAEDLGISFVKQNPVEVR